MKMKPTKCYYCKTPGVEDTTANIYLEVLYDGVLHKLELIGAPVRKCSLCGEMTFGNDYDDFVDKVLKEKGISKK